MGKTSVFYAIEKVQEKLGEIPEIDLKAINVEELETINKLVSEAYNEIDSILGELQREFD